jgi:hypothetical protein
VHELVVLPVVTVMAILESYSNSNSKDLYYSKKGFKGVSFYMKEAYGCAFAFLVADSIVHAHALGLLMGVHHLFGLGCLVAGGYASVGQLLFVIFAAIGEFGSGARGIFVAFPSLDEAIIQSAHITFDITNYLVIVIMILNIRTIYSDKYLFYGLGAGVCLVAGRMLY